MISRRAVLALLPGIAVKAMPAHAIERGQMIPAADLDWAFLADTVMGGVSEGTARIEDGALRLTGTVSTENRGGFIQARTALPEGLPVGTSAVRVRVRGNGERYFVHLRTTRTRLPWQYYQAGFETSGS